MMNAQPAMFTIILLEESLRYSDGAMEMVPARFTKLIDLPPRLVKASMLQHGNFVVLILRSLGFLILLNDQTGFSYWRWKERTGNEGYGIAYTKLAFRGPPTTSETPQTLGKHLWDSLSAEEQKPVSC